MAVVSSILRAPHQVQPEITQRALAFIITSGLTCSFSSPGNRHFSKGQFGSGFEFKVVSERSGLPVCAPPPYLEKFPLQLFVFCLILFFFLFSFLFICLHFVVPVGISPMGNSGRFPEGKAAATESR